jgi:hypothetical protein
MDFSTLPLLKALGRIAALCAKRLPFKKLNLQFRKRLYLKFFGRLFRRISD